MPIDVQCILIVLKNVRVMRMQRQWMQIHGQGDTSYLLPVVGGVGTLQIDSQDGNSSIFCIVDDAVTLHKQYVSGGKFCSDHFQRPRTFALQ